MGRGYGTAGDSARAVEWGWARAAEQDWASATGALARSALGRVAGGRAVNRSQRSAQRPLAAPGLGDRHARAAGSPAGAAWPRRVRAVRPTWTGRARAARWRRRCRRPWRPPRARWRPVPMPSAGREASARIVPATFGARRAARSRREAARLAIRCGARHGSPPPRPPAGALRQARRTRR